MNVVFFIIINIIYGIDQLHLQCLVFVKTIGMITLEQMNHLSLIITCLQAALGREHRPQPWLM